MSKNGELDCLYRQGQLLVTSNESCTYMPEWRSDGWMELSR